jgi:hypothetical protein
MVCRTYAFAYRKIDLEEAILLTAYQKIESTDARRAFYLCT